MDTYPHEASHIELGFDCDEEVAIGFQLSHEALDDSAATTAAGLQRSNAAKVTLANTHTRGLQTGGQKSTTKRKRKAENVKTSFIYT